MKYICTLLVVEHMERSKQFYREVLGQEVVSDLGANVTLSCGLSLQTMDSWKQFTRLEQISLGHNASELYFETEDLDAFEERLRSMPISYVHPVHQQPWGQRAMRFMILTATSLKSVKPCPVWFAASWPRGLPWRRWPSVWTSRWST